MLLNFPSRAMHDAGLAAWFGGTLANAVSLNRATTEADRPAETGQITNTGWDAWVPVNAVAVGAHLVGRSASWPATRGARRPKRASAR